MDWNSLNLIEYSTFVSKFNGDRFSEKKNEKNFHLFMPWCEYQAFDLMFQFKNILKEKSTCYIPIMQKDLTATIIKESTFKLLNDQLERGVETHLYMSNLDSIHIWKIKAIHSTQNIDKTNFVSSSLFLLKDFYQWIEVEDLFVYKASHMEAKEEVIRELESLSLSKMTQDLFYSLNRFHGKEAFGTKWLDLKRDVTYDYFIRGSDLKENIYSDVWQYLSRLSQHYLVLSDQCRHQAIATKGSEKLSLLKSAFDHYTAGILSELNEIYIYPLCELYFNYSSLKEAWEEVSSMTNPHARTILESLFSQDQNGVSHLEDFLSYAKYAKSFLFSLKAKFSKKIGREEFLIIENALTKQENLIDSFGCKNLDAKLHNLIKIQELFKQRNDNLDTLKFTHILSLMSSTSKEDNLFFKIIEEKTSKGIPKKSLEEEIQNLCELKPFLQAA